MDQRVLDALTEEVSELAVRLAAEPERIRWTGEVIPMTKGGRVVGARAAIVPASATPCPILRWKRPMAAA